MFKKIFVWSILVVFTMVLCATAMAASGEPVIDIDAFLDRLEAIGIYVTPTTDCIPASLQLREAPYVSLNQQADGSYILTTNFEFEQAWIYVPGGMEGWPLKPTADKNKYATEPVSKEIESMSMWLSDCYYEWKVPSLELVRTSSSVHIDGYSLSVELARNDYYRITDNPVIRYQVHNDEAYETLDVSYDMMTDAALMYYYSTSAMPYYAIEFKPDGTIYSFWFQNQDHYLSLIEQPDGFCWWETDHASDYLPPLTYDEIPLPARLLTK